MFYGDSEVERERERELEDDGRQEEKLEGRARDDNLVAIVINIHGIIYLIFIMLYSPILNCTVWFRLRPHCYIIILYHIVLIFAYCSARYCTTLY